MALCTKFTPVQYSANVFSLQRLYASPSVSPGRNVIQSAKARFSLLSLIICGFLCCILFTFPLPVSQRTDGMADVDINEVMRMMR